MLRSHKEILEEIEGRREAFLDAFWDEMRKESKDAISDEEYAELSKRYPEATPECVTAMLFSNATRMDDIRTIGMALKEFGLMIEVKESPCGAVVCEISPLTGDPQ